MTQLPPRPTLALIAGPNGAGKSTFYETVVKPRFKAPFINADIIQRDELQDPDLMASYRAGKIAAERHGECIGAGKSFVTETVFSHPSKLDLLKTARAAGFRLVVFHLLLESADLAVARVAQRYSEGGHDVPEDKVRARFQRNGTYIREGVLMADRGAVYDASGLNTAPRQLATFNRGVPDYVADGTPDIFTQIYGGDCKPAES